METLLNICLYSLYGLIIGIISSIIIHRKTINHRRNLKNANSSFYQQFKILISNPSFKESDYQILKNNIVKEYGISFDEIDLLEKLKTKFLNENTIIGDHNVKNYHTKIKNLNSLKEDEPKSFFLKDVSINMYEKDYIQYSKNVNFTDKLQGNLLLANTFSFSIPVLWILSIGVSDNNIIWFAGLLYSYANAKNFYNFKLFWWNSKYLRNLISKLK